MRFQVKIPKRWSGLSLHAILERCHPQSSSEEWQRRWINQQVLIDGRKVDWHQVIQQGQYLEYWVEGYQEPVVPTDWHLLWENDELFAVNKPAMLPVSQTTRNPKTHLIGLIREAGYPDAHLLHRLDLETSGILLVGKNQQAAQFWQPQLAQLMMLKEYHALVWGEPKWNEYHMDCQLATRTGSPIRCQMHVCLEEEMGKSSQTHFKVIERYGRFSLISCRLLTGRKHQIRAHLSHLGYPIIGDKIYSCGGEYYLKRLKNGLSNDDYHALGAYHHLLHAYRVLLMINNKSVELINKKCLTDSLWKY